MSESDIAVPSGKNSLIVPKLEHLALENLSLKTAETEEEIQAAQHLRYEVFYKEMGAKPTQQMMDDEREYEEFDPYCKHLLVIDNNAPKGKHIVGTYRVLMPDCASSKGMGLYTEKEYDISKLKATGDKIMEISRSCVLEAYRSKLAINLLWKGIAAYVFANNVDYLIGVPSFNGTNLEEHKESLAYLNTFHAADEAIRPRVRDEFYHPLPLMDKEKIDVRKTFMSLPPLLKGYLRVGSVIGDGAYIDEQFNCIDVVIILEIKNAKDNYFNHYKRHDAE